jgi:hypothetical protein
MLEFAPNCGLTAEGRVEVQAWHDRNIQNRIEKDLAKFSPPTILPPDPAQPDYLSPEIFVKVMGEVVRGLQTEIDRHAAVSKALVEDDLNLRIKALQAEVDTLREAGNPARATTAVKDLVTRALEERRTMTYAGVWRAPVDYPVNSVVTDHGALWLALCGSKSVRPGSAAVAWVMICKSGGAV